MTPPTDPRLEQLALALDQAAQSASPITQWSEPQGLSLAQAYAVQSHLVALRCARGDVVVGLKQAFNNRAMMQRMGLAEPVTGILCRDMQLDDGGTLDMSRLQLPRVEIEVMFKLAQPLPAGATVQQARALVQAIAVAIEIVDSRYCDFRFSANDVVADNASACGFVIGPWQAMPQVLGGLAVTLEIDGAVAAHGNTSSILGDPLQALCSCAQLAARDHRPLAGGAMVLAGSAIDPFAIRPGQRVGARIEGLGAIGFTASQR